MVVLNTRRGVGNTGRKLDDWLKARVAPVPSSRAVPDWYTKALPDTLRRESKPDAPRSEGQMLKVMLAPGAAEGVNDRVCVDETVR